MLDSRFIKLIQKDIQTYASLRRSVITASDDALHISKRAIFAMHRGELKEAKAKLSEATRILRGLQKQYKKDTQLLQEGAYRAALEEYAEAALLHQFFSKKKLGDVPVALPGDVYLAGLSDVPGELYRVAIHAATAGDRKTVSACMDTAEDIVGALVELNLTGYLRTKFDQAKQALQKIERVQYDLSL